MRASDLFRGLCLAFLALAASPLRAGQDPFDAWSVSGYAQLLEINRPAGGLPPTGPLDDFGDAANGYTRDGLYFRMLNISLSGPLGWPGTRAVLGTQVNQGTASLTDVYAQKSGAFGSFRLGQVYLPFGAEQQLSSKDLPGIQRGLIYGFEDYGATQDWGLQLMNQRGWGLRWDCARPLAGPLQAILQAGAQDFGGGVLYQNALGGVGRAALDWEQGGFGAQLGYSALLARGQLLTPPSEFTPLGAPQGAPSEGATDLSGHAVVETWGPDAQADAGPLHGRAEMALQSLHGFLRGGGQATAGLDLDAVLAGLGAPPAWQGAYLYVEWEQAFSDFGDGVHQTGALYRAQVYGLRLPLGWDALSLKLESLQVSKAASGALMPDGRIYQAQLQLEL
ncbi:MAG TPA: hypothetical protein VK914_04290 [bacterium]|jgi:hypothetical protein|nr:hypothetical protein [bacterium]